jgi:hypothetical protein
MAKKKDQSYSVGYKKPPRETQFKPGNSGNPKGRPRKPITVADVLWNELNSPVSIVTDGKRRKISLLRAILKQHANKAASGNRGSAALVLNELKFRNAESGDNLGLLVQEFRAINAQNVERGEIRETIRQDPNGVGDRTENHAQKEQANPLKKGGRTR